MLAIDVHTHMLSYARLDRIGFSASSAAKSTFDKWPSSTMMRRRHTAFSGNPRECGSQIR